MTNKIVKEIYKVKKRTGYACGVTITGDLFIGYINQPHGLEFFKMTDENKAFVISQFELNKKFA